ncbi:unnamed protein product [Rhizophagus irregularis]|nr:unnamed protein product [Rhizophagus irregularis]
MSENWGKVQQPNFLPDTSWESSVSKPNNIRSENWERPPSAGNWGTERPSASSPSENNLSARKAAQGSWGPNKSENSWVMRNENVQVDQSSWKRNEEPPISTTSYNNVKRENDEEKLDVGIEQSFESYNERQNIVLDEDDYDPSYRSFPTSSKPQLGKPITPFDDEIQYNNMYNVKSHVEPLITSSISTFQELRKEFRNAAVQTEPIDLAAISASNEKLLSCTISSQIKKGYQQTSQDLSRSTTNSVSEKKYPPQQPSLLDVDPEELNTKVSNFWNTSSGNPNFREGTAAIPHTRSDSSSRGEVNSWNTTQRTSARNDNRGPVPQPIPVEPDSWDSPQTSTRNDNRGVIPQPIPVEPDSWDSPQTSTRNDNRGAIPQPISVEPDSWDSTPRTDNRGTVPKPIPVEPDSWDSAPQPPQAPTRNDNRVPVPQPIPVEPDSWDSTPRNDNRGPVPKPIPVEPDSWDSPQTSTRNDNRGTVPKPIPVEPDSWDSAPQPPQAPTRNDNRVPVPQPIPVEPDSWDSTSTRNDNRGPVPKPIPVESDSWNSAPQTSTRNDNRGTVPKPIPVEPDSWDSAPQTSAQNDRGPAFKPLPSWNTISQPSQDNSWGSGPQQPSASGPPESDWTKKAEMYSKELGEKNEIKTWVNNTGQKVEDSYGTGASDSYYDNSSSNNRYGSRGCHNCGQEGHLVRDCPKKQGSSGRKSCHKCGKEGHFIRDCTEENGKDSYSGYSGGGYGGGKPCHKCGKEGHFVRDCTEEGGGYGGGKPCHKCGKEGHFIRDCTEEGGGYGGGKSCRKCGKEGHFARECKEDAYETTREDGGYGGGSREFNNSGPSRSHTNKPSPFSNPERPNITSQEAWDKLLKAADENDTDDFKEALESYAKVTPEETFVTIEKKLRSANSKGRIISFERPEIPLTKVLVDLQGNTNKRYVATPTLVHPTRLPRTSGNRANGPEENLQWLADSGFMVDDRSPVCFNCKRKGHITKDCTEPRREVEKLPYLMCQNCSSSEHITKFCPEERRDYYAEARDRKAAGSHKGGSMEHSTNEDRASSGYGGEEDRKGHRGYGGNSNITCFNCNREGHTSRECPDPRRSSGGRKCNKCGEEGHISKDCSSSSGGDYDRGNYNSSGGWQRDSSSRNNDRTATWNSQDKSGDNTWNKNRNDNYSQGNSWNKSRGDNSSRGDYNQDNNTWNKNRTDSYPQDNYKPRGDNSSRGDYNQDNNTLNKNRTDSYPQDNYKPRGDNSSRGDYNQDNNTLNKNRTDSYPQDNYKHRGDNSSRGDYNQDNNTLNKNRTDSYPQDNFKPRVDNSSRGDYNQENKTRSDNYSQDNYRSKGGNSSHGDYNQDNSWNKDSNNNNNPKDNPWNKFKADNISRDDDNVKDQPVKIEVESDSWDSKPVTGNIVSQTQKQWGNMTAADLGWEKPKENITSAPEGYENGRGRGNEQRERTLTSENYDNRRGRGYEQRERPASENYENRRGRGYERYEQRDRPPASENYENRRGRGNEQRERTPASENHENRRSRANEPREERGPSYTNSSRTQSNDGNNKSSNLVEETWW